MTTLRALAASALLLGITACDDDNTAGVTPVLSVDEVHEADPTGEAEYLLDFGEVVIGASSTRVLRLNNLGRAALSLEAPAVTSPFELETEGARVIEGNGEDALTLFFMPLALGEAQQVLKLESDGGESSVRLVGRGVERVVCEAVVSPSAVDFGQVSEGQSTRATVTITNPGSGPCVISSIVLTEDSNPDMAIELAPSAGTSVVQGSPLEVEVSYSPQNASSGQRGTLVVSFGALSRRVALSGNGIPAAAEPAYANTSTALFRFDPDTGASVKIGDFHDAEDTKFSMVDIGIDPFGVVYGLSNKKLWSINPETAECTFIADLPELINSPDGLTVLPDGRLVAADKFLAVIDTRSAQITQMVVPASAGYDTAGDVIALPDGKLYWSVRNGNGDDDLVRVDPDSGTIHKLGSLEEKGVWGLAYEAKSDRLYGFTNTGRLITVNWRTGEVLENVQHTGTWWGATSNPADW